MMKQIDNYSQIVSWAKLWFHGQTEKKTTCQQQREMDIRSRQYLRDVVQQQQQQQLVVRLTFQKFKQLNTKPSSPLRRLIHIQNMWKQCLNQPTILKIEHLLLFALNKKKKRLTPPSPKRKSFASSTIVYTLIQHHHNHDLIQILPIEHQLLIHKQHISINSNDDDDDDDNIPLGNLIK